MNCKERLAQLHRGKKWNSKPPLVKHPRDPSDCFEESRVPKQGETPEPQPMGVLTAGEILAWCGNSP